MGAEWITEERKLYSKPKGLETFDFKAVPKIQFTVQSEGDEAFEKKLKQYYKSNVRSEGGKTDGPSADIFAKGIVYKLENTREKMSAMAKTGDSVTIENGVYSILSKRSGKTYFLRLNADAPVSADLEKTGMELHEIGKSKKERAEKKKRLVDKAHRQWTKLLNPGAGDEEDSEIITAQQRGSVVNFIKALAGGKSEYATRKNRRQIWERMPAEAKVDATGDPLPEKYQKSGIGLDAKRAQNAAMIRYLADLARTSQIEMLDNVMKGDGTEMRAEKPAPKPTRKTGIEGDKSSLKRKEEPLAKEKALPKEAKKEEAKKEEGKLKEEKKPEVKEKKEGGMTDEEIIKLCDLAEKQAAEFTGEDGITARMTIFNQSVTKLYEDAYSLLKKPKVEQNDIDGFTYKMGKLSDVWLDLSESLTSLKSVAQESKGLLTSAASQKLTKERRIQVDIAQLNVDSVNSQTNQYYKQLNDGSFNYISGLNTALLETKDFKNGLPKNAQGILRYGIVEHARELIEKGVMKGEMPATPGEVEVALRMAYDQLTVAKQYELGPALLRLRDAVKNAQNKLPATLIRSLEFYDFSGLKEPVVPKKRELSEKEINALEKPLDTRTDKEKSIYTRLASVNERTNLGIADAQMSVQTAIFANAVEGNATSYLILRPGGLKFTVLKDSREPNKFFVSRVQGNNELEIYETETNPFGERNRGFIPANKVMDAITRSEKNGGQKFKIDDNGEYIPPEGRRK